MHIVDEATAKRLVSIQDAIVVVEWAFLALETGDAKVFPITQGHGSGSSTRFGVKPGFVQSKRLVGMKVGSYWPDNRAKGVPNHGSTTLFLSDETGFPYALVSSSYLTALRTAAADAVAVRYLANSDASKLGVIGAGNQAWFEIAAVATVRDISQLLVWSRSRTSAEALASRVRKELKIDAHYEPLEKVVCCSDIVVTITAARQPLVQRAWVNPGTHISAMGADGVGKQELSAELLRGSGLFADVIAQSEEIGEFQHAGSRDRKNIRTLGSVISDPALGRDNADQITIFDSSGTAIQDLAIGAFALERTITNRLTSETSILPR